MTTILDVVRDLEALHSDHCSAGTAVLIVTGIRTLVESGKTTWVKLGTTDRNISEQLYFVQVRGARKDLETMQRTKCMTGSAMLMAQEIRALIESDEITWDNLGFTDDDLHQAIFRCAQHDFVKMLDPYFGAITNGHLADGIRAFVKNSEALWEDLGFTELEVTECLEEAQARTSA